MVRSATSTVVVMGLARQARVNADELTLFKVDDLANGTAVAQFGDDTGTQCDRFVVEPAQKVDFVLVIDNSGSMSNEQAAVAKAATEISARLSQSTIDFRISVIATDVDNRTNDVAQWDIVVLPTTNTPKICDFTASPFGVQRCVRFDLNGDGDIADTVSPPFDETKIGIDLNNDGDALDTAVALITEANVAFDINGDGDTLDSVGTGGTISTTLVESGLGTGGSGEENGFRPMACILGRNVSGAGIDAPLLPLGRTNITAIDDNGLGGTVLFTAVGHGFLVGDRVVVSGATGYNATYTVAELIGANQVRTVELEPADAANTAPQTTGSVQRVLAGQGGAQDGESCGRDANRAPYPAANTFPTPPGTFQWLPRATNDKRKLRTGADLAVIFVTDANEQSDGQYTRLNAANYPGDAVVTQSIPTWVSFFSDFDNTTAGSQRAFVHGIVCPNFGDCTDEGDGTPGNESYETPRYQQLISLMEGIEAALPADNDPLQAQKIADAIRLILQVTVAQASPYVLTKPPISTSIKIALESTVTTFGACNKNDVPRSRVNGFDYDGTTTSVQFFGSCRPTFDVANLGRPITVSYKYWIEDSDDDDGNIDPCALCTDPLICVVDTCVCPADCGTGGLPANLTCNTTTCLTECLPDCGGCDPGFTCDTGACACACNDCNGSAPGLGFTCDLSTCEYECNDCPGTAPSPFSQCNLTTCEIECPDCGGGEVPSGFFCNTNPAVCDVECQSDCGGCSPGLTCDVSSCSCFCEDCNGPAPAAGFACNQDTCEYECGACLGTPPGPFSTCNFDICQFECTGCGTGALQPGFVCNDNPLVCAIECLPDCGGCSGAALCDTDACACSCPADCGGNPPRLDMTCNQTTCVFECLDPPVDSVAPGGNFVWDPATCDYVCDPAQCGVNTIGPEAICDLSTCELRCPGDCGGCEGNLDCTLSTCSCDCPADCGGPAPSPDFTCNQASCGYECLAVPVTPAPGPNFVWDQVACRYECAANCGEAAAPAFPEFCNQNTCEIQCLPACGGCAVGEQCNSSACACECVPSATCSPGFAWDTNSCSCSCDVGQRCPSTHVLNVETCACECGEDAAGIVNCNNACTAATPLCQPSLCSCQGIDVGG